MRISGFLFLIIALYLTGCVESANNKEGTDTQTNTKDEDCLYSYDHATTGVYWTAYKHAAKAPVNGTFDSLQVEGTKASHSPLGVIEGAVLHVLTGSISSQDTSRDRKIRQYFFGQLNDGYKVTGKVKSLEGSEYKGTAEVLLKINNIEKETVFTYLAEGNVLKLTADIHLEQWSGQEALSSLNSVCKEKHTGPDGNSKLWPDVKIVVETALKKDCK